MKAFLGLLLVSLLFVQCDSLLLGEEDEIVSLDENVSTPIQLSDGLQVGALSDAGVNEESIIRFISSLQSDNRNIHSLLIIKNGKLIVESYFNGWHRNRLQSIRSASKSITSALIGISIDQGLIVDEEEKVFHFFPSYSHLKTNEKEEISIRHLLMMSSGLAWNQTSYPDDDPRNDEFQLGQTNDGFKFILEKDLVRTPGTAFNYSSGNSDLLAGIIYEASGMYADEFGRKFFFEPLGIEHAGWRRNNNGHPNAGFGIHLYPRDFIKVGKLFLDSGVWNNQQIVSKEWVAKSTSKAIDYPFDNNQGYGYQWWTRNWDVNGQSIQTFNAQGNGGQVLCVIPEKHAVILLTGGNFGQAGQLPYRYLQAILLPALQ